jgi:hypothetical protein
MSEAQQKKRRQLKIARLEIVAEMYKRGNSVRKISEEVKQRLNLKTYALATVQRDIQSLLKEWRESRIEDMDLALQLELTRIDDTVKELWEQWEKSKTDYTKTSTETKGAPKKDKETGTHQISTYDKKRTEIEMIALGNPQYISEIRQQLAERRKLLGLYAPDRKELTGKDGKDLMFEPIMIEIIDSRNKVENAEDTDN